MKRNRNISRVRFLFILTAQIGIAQINDVNKVFELYADKKLDSAKVLIDQIVQTPESAKDYKAWMIRGFVYKDLYKTKEINNITSPYRDSSTASLIRAIKSDVGNRNEQTEAVVKSLNYLASLYNNDINKSLDTIHFKQALVNSDKHKEIKKFLDPSFDEKKYNYDVYSSIGSMFEKGYEQSMSKNLLDLAKTYLLKAYEINANTDFINKNLGVLYYNQAVDIIKKMDYDVPLDQLPVYQDQSVKLGLQALPYLLKAHEIKPSDRSIVEGLTGIYYLLNDSEKHNEYKKILEEMNKH